jgi:predicted transglutaminase-like cysteine proteinase
VGGSAPIPIGAFQFCQAHPADCGKSQHPESVVSLSPSLWQQLVEVNDAVNAAVIPETDEAHYHVAEYWAYPDGAGDCEDFALEKRRQLILDGWNPSTLLITVVRQADGQGHAVLTVRTDQGDFILDNQDARVAVWYDTPYQFLKRQSQLNPAKWVSLVDDRPSIVTTAAVGAVSGQ